jgi:hypothetical protein
MFAGELVAGSYLTSGESSHQCRGGGGGGGGGSDQFLWFGSQSICRQNDKLFLQSSELRFPHPLTRRRVCTPPPPCFRGGGGYTSFRERGWGGPNSDEGTDTVVL